jgi:hypothetical protein
MIVYGHLYGIHLTSPARRAMRQHVATQKEHCDAPDIENIPTEHLLSSSLTMIEHPARRTLCEGSASHGSTNCGTPCI